MYLIILLTVTINLSYLDDRPIAAAVSNSQTITTLQSIPASEAFDTMKSQVGNFVENSKNLVMALDKVGGVHSLCHVWLRL